jgi:hypothetical protein
MNIRGAGAAATMVAATAAIGMGITPANAAVKPPHPVNPDINRSSCNGDALAVWQSGYHHEDCFENTGAQDVVIYSADNVYTGDNGTYFQIGGIGCSDPYKWSWASPNLCVFPLATMSYISIYPGTSM